MLRDVAVRVLIPVSDIGISEDIDPDCNDFTNDDGINASQACCFCGGGTEIDGNCIDFEDFYDIDGDNCSWYGKYDDGQCNPQCWANCDLHDDFLLTD